MYQLIPKHEERIIILSLILHTQYLMTQVLGCYFCENSQETVGEHVNDLYIAPFRIDINNGCQCPCDSELPTLITVLLVIFGHKRYAGCSLIYLCFQLHHSYTLTVVLIVYESNEIKSILLSR